MQANLLAKTSFGDTNSKKLENNIYFSSIAQANTVKLLQLFSNEQKEPPKFDAH